MERRNQVDAVPAAEQKRLLRANRAHRPWGQRFDERLREPQVRDRPNDSAILDQPDTVAGQARYDLRLRVEDPGVPEVGDHEAATATRCELIRACGASRQ